MKKHLIYGLIILLPLAMTIAVIGFIVNFLTKPFVGFVSQFLSQTSFAKEGFLFLTHGQALKFSSQLIILAGIFLIILLIGMIARWYLVHWIFQVSDNLIHKLPLVNKVYKTTKEIITNLFGPGTSSFKQVVVVPFPLEGVYGLGLLSQKAPDACDKSADCELISVFVPTAPNPTTGFTMMYCKEDIVYIDMKVEEAVKYIISCGTISPTDEDDLE